MNDVNKCQRSEMSNLLQTDIFNVLNTDHGKYLKPYQETWRLPYGKEPGALEITLRCRDLGKKNVLKRIDQHSSLEPHEKAWEEQPCPRQTTVGCRELVEKIHRICNSYSRKCFYIQEDKQVSAKIIKNFLTSIRNKNIFISVKEHLLALRKKDPVALLRLVNCAHAEIFEKSSFRLILRLDGSTFPPTIVYKFFPDQDKINLIDLHCRLGNGKRIRTLGQFKWYNFSVYKCNICKTTVKIKPKTKIARKKKPVGNSISWIQEMYG